MAAEVANPAHYEIRVSEDSHDAYGTFKTGRRDDP
jgi:hypothetical protein